MGALSNLSTGQKVALGAAGLGSLALLGQTEEEEEGPERRPFPKGEMFDITARSRETGEVYQLMTQKIWRITDARSLTLTIITAARSTVRGPAPLIPCPPVCPTANS